VRIAVATQNLHPVGGVETYLGCVLPALAARGHGVSVWHESTQPPGVARIAPAAIPSCRIGPDVEGVNRALEHLTKYAPEVIFLHGLSDPALESRLAAISSLVIFLHTYHGTCISGTKTHSFPTPRACSRCLGPACLLHYYPRRCGGWSPVTMVKSYVRQRQRQTLLRAGGFVTTLSEHMRRECIAQGVDATRVIHLPAFAPSGKDGENTPGTSRPAGPRSGNGLWHLLFAGRMERLKGGQVFLDALDRLPSGVRRHVRVTFAGDGRERDRWERGAARVSRGELEIRFVGWLSAAERSALLATVDLLVVPSLWPEPLGLIGLEAAAAGIPAVAFDVGGIRDWLTDGVTGRLVSAAPPSGTLLARGLEDCLNAPETLAAWGNAAMAQSRRLTLTKHVDALEQVLLRAAVARADSGPQITAERRA
jgi:glycosyltransferase involved in cell wall biosynthesis